MNCHPAATYARRLRAQLIGIFTAIRARGISGIRTPNVFAKDLKIRKLGEMRTFLIASTFAYFRQLSRPNLRGGIVSN